MSVKLKAFAVSLCGNCIVSLGNTHELSQNTMASMLRLNTAKAIRSNNSLEVSILSTESRAWICSGVIVARAEPTQRAYSACCALGPDRKSVV